MNKMLVPMIRYATEANINTYITSNFSFSLSDERLRELIGSGLTSLIVAVDGISEATFGRQRVNGRWKLIESNLRRFVQLANGKGPKLILQYIMFDHNHAEIGRVDAFCRELGIEPLMIWGSTEPWIRGAAPREGWQPHPAKRLPRCAWP